MSNPCAAAKSFQRPGIILALSALLFSTAALAQAALSTPISPPVPRMIVPEAHLPIRLQRVDIRAEVLGSLAHTRIEMVFYNPNQRLLEGELQFPLLDGQVVTGFALDINAELRPAVPVEKSKGQQVFEDVTRTRIDPALLEKTQGNNYKLRVYPLPAQGTRRVVLEIDEVLSESRADNSGVQSTTYRLPLQYAETVEQLDVAVVNPAIPHYPSAMAVRARLGAEPIRASYAYDKQAMDGSLVNFSRKNYVGKEILTVDFPQTDEPLIATGRHEDQTYFYAELALPPGKPASRTAPRTLSMVWDASGSGAARDHGREFGLLDAYFKALGSVTVELVVARDRAEAPQKFNIQGGDWQALRNVLENVVYDGATSAAALSPSKTADLALLFSDGLSNYGVGAFEAGVAPVYAVNAVASADLPRLRAVTEGTGGQLLDLLDITAADAVYELTHQRARLVGMRSDAAKELVSASVYGQGNRLEIAGILSEPQAVIILDWLDAQGQHQLQQMPVRDHAIQATTLAANRWASLQLAQLDADYSANRAAIRRLGNRFSMVTRETSLIILDRVEDYVRYEIVPPLALRGEYESQLAMKAKQLGDERRQHLDDMAERFAQKIAWWGKTFPKGEKPKPQRSRDDSGDGVRALSAAPPPPAPIMAMAAARDAETSSQRTASVKASVESPVEVGIHLKKWEPDTPYAKRLRATAPEQMYRVYLDERPSFANSTAFFLDAADIFIERGQVDLGLRILSNLAEMNLENRHILRILAYRLLQAKQARLALPILQQVLTLSPNEPQSWRDLGLAYADDAQYQLAVNNLWEVVAQPWHNRFPDIELVALAEMNAIMARAPQGAVDTSRMDARLLRNLPLDVRAVLSWDADNTDIDLWITDPNDEKVYFANRLGYQGGAMSRDFTGGFGPEEFSLHHAKPGKYKVQANFYGNRQQIVAGATTLMLRLSTGFGTSGQKDENIVLRLTGQGEVVDVGSFEVKPSSVLSKAFWPLNWWR